MIIKVVTGFVGECPYRQIFLDNVGGYCNKHGYELVTAFNDGNQKDIYEHPKGLWWRKQAIIAKELKGCDALLWIDMDCVIINKQIRIEDLLKQMKGYDVMLSAVEPELTAQGDGTVETGAMLFRSNDWVKNFIGEWCAFSGPENNHNALNIILDIQPEVWGHFKITKPEDFTVKHVHYNSRTAKTFIMHVPGSEMEDKVKFMTEYSKQFDIRKDVYAEFINLPHRTDRLQKMQAELSRVGITANRRRGLFPHEVKQPDNKTHVMRVRTPGAIGCHYSQVAVMEYAYAQGKSALVMEDDLVFCSDLQKRLDYIQNFLNCHEWDIFWLGGTYHKPAEWHKEGHHADLQMCECKNGVDVIETDDPKIVRTFGCWSTYGYIVNYKSIPKILELLDMNVYRSMGIDWLMILLQPQLKTFAYHYGCVKQYDNLSDIGMDGNRPATTYFSGFAQLGSHWFKDVE